MINNARELIINRSKTTLFITPKIIIILGTPIRLGARDLVGISSL